MLDAKPADNTTQHSNVYQQCLAETAKTTSHILAALVKCQSTFRGKPWLSKIVACHSLAHQWYRSVTLRVHIRHKNVCAPSSHMHCNDHHLQLQCDTKNRLASTATHTEKIQEKHKESLPNHALNILHNIEYITSYITILPVI